MTTEWIGLIESLPSVINAVLSHTSLHDLSGLLAALERSGLGKEVESWLGTQTNNLPISQDQLRGVLNDKQIQDFARKLGIPVDQVLKTIATALPDAVDRQSPMGKLMA